MTAAPSECPACPNPKAAGDYLCVGCWYTLPHSARARLNSRDGLAVRRLAELLAQIKAGNPSRLIEISIR